MPNNSFRKVKVDKRSGFDKSFRTTLTANVGTLVPILVDELCPDTKVHLKEALAASLPPLVSDTYMNVRLRVEAFVVPERLCQANFEDFFIDYPVDTIDGTNAGSTAYTYNEGMKGCVPLIRVNYADDTVSIPDTSLFDYMGIPSFQGNFNFEVPAGPFIAYHLIWQEWYRNPRVQKPAFMRSDGTLATYFVGNSAGVPPAALMPYVSTFFASNGSQPTISAYVSSDSYKYVCYLLADNETYITQLRQRNFGLDFFTSAMVEPQQGDMARVVIQSESGVDGFTIASLRAQNSIQQFRERNNLTSPRYQQQIYARYGVAPSDGVIQRPVLVGAATYDVYSHGVTQTNAGTDDGYGHGPFAYLLGNRGGLGYATGSDFLIENFHAKEPMYLIVLASLVPEVSYSQCFNPVFLRYKGLGSISDMANGILQNVGPEPILVGQLYGSAGSVSDFNDVFAYADRYSTWMIRNNEVHGEFKDSSGTGTLKNFVLQRSFSAKPEYGSEFLEIPTTYLDDVMQITSSTLGFGYWMDIAFDYKVSMPLQEYAIPSLQDPGYEHGRTIVLRKNGQLL